MTSQKDYVFDWNRLDDGPLQPAAGFTVLDETLRDGIQSPSVTDPPVGAKIEMFHLLERLGVGVANIGIPAAGPRSRHDAFALAREVASSRMRLRASAAARTMVCDIVPIVEASQAAGIPIEVYAFIGASPIRLVAEGWDLSAVLRRVEEAAQFAVREGMTLCLVTEDTTRSHPDMLEQIYRTAIGLGVRRLCLCDTVGHATPAGVRRLHEWVQSLLTRIGEPVKLDWHGHNDRGLALANALCAVELGFDRVHGTGLGIGERVGNVALDHLLVNLKLLGAWDHDLSALIPYCETVSRACRTRVPCNYPVIGRDAFRTGTGVHAAAILKAAKRGDSLADTVYSSIEAGSFGRYQVIEIGPMSGISNVCYWLEHHGFIFDDALAHRILVRAKAANRVLKDDELMEILRECSAEAAAEAG